ncbi:MAG: c-type cytochrome, partial [Candidatus Saccharimonas sp.]|nr:c-type cytochrome [Planctomycetaceae bacterium]
PQGFGQSLYTCDWGRSIVYRHPLTKNGAGFTAKQEPFVELPRPTDMDIDAGGNIYISSWRDGGFNFSKPEVGYVVMVKPPTGDSKGTNGTKGTEGTANGKREPGPSHLLAGLASPSHTIRLNTQRDILANGESTGIADGVEKLAASNSSDAVRVAAIFTLKQLLGEKSHDALVRLAKDAPIREHALRAIADRTTQLANTSPQPFVEALTDASARVRLQAVRGLARFGKVPREVEEKMLPLTVDRDPIVAHVAIDSLVQLRAADVCLASLNSKATDEQTLAQRIGATAVLRRLHEPAVVSGLIEWLGRPVAVQPGGPTGQAATYGTTRQLVLAVLCRLHSREGEYTGDWWSTRPDTSGPYYKPVAWSETERITRVLQVELATGDPGFVQKLLVQLKRHKIELPGTTERIVALAHADKTFFARAVELLAPGSSTLSGDAARLLEVAATLDKSQAELRVTALRGLLRRTGQPEVLETALRTFAEIGADESNGDVVAAWNEFIREPVFAKHVAKLGEMIGSPNVLVASGGESLAREYFYAILVQVADNPRGEKAERDAALKLVERAWSQPELAVSLLRAIGRSNAESQSLAVQTQLKSDRPEVKAAAQFAAAKLELDKEPPLDPQKPLLAGLKYEDLLTAVASAKGDDKYGRKLFARQGCVACHTVSQNEPPKGPLLLDIAKRYKRDELIESIVKPSAKIAQGFEAQFFATRDGKIYDGFVVRESGDEVELRNVAGVSVVLQKSNVEERGRRDLSVMPLGLVDKLNADQLASLLVYMESLKGK